MKKRTLLTSLVVLLIALLAIAPVSAQEETPDLTIRLRRDFGYGGFSNDIQGTFTINTEGPASLQEVRFYLDDTLMGTDSTEPFSLQFNTDNFEPGIHRISAVAVLADGSEIESNVYDYEFLSNEEAMGKTTGLVFPILGVTILVVILGAVLPMLTGKKKGGQFKVGEYSLAGGTVCPNCELPFSRHAMAPNMVFGKLERCPHCGKISIRPRASLAALAEAEARYLAKDQETAQIEVDPEENIRRALDDSRFDD